MWVSVRDAYEKEEAFSNKGINMTWRGNKHEEIEGERR